MAVSHNLTKAEAAERARLLDVGSYEVYLDLTASETTFRSRTEIRFGCAEPGAATFVEIAAESVVSAVLNGRELDAGDWTPAGGLRLPGLAGENHLVVDAVFAYARDGKGMHRAVDPADGAVYLWTHFESNDAQRVFACFDQPDLKAVFDFHVTIPYDWRAVSNMPAEVTESAPDGTVLRFARTPRMSTYLTAVCTGPYHVVTDTHDGVELALYCRRSLRDSLESEHLFAVTKAGLDHFNAHFGVRYPLPKYDQIAVPEYNSGATENFGAVVFAEEYFVFRSAVTAAERELRAYIMMHEMAHMWFGDLVTMRWWDELWLKESFATWAGKWATASVTEFTEVWTSFQISNKNAAYKLDQSSVTHPIRAEIADIATGRSNYDAITYSKGASVIKQLVAYVGLKPFLAGLRDYFGRHAYGVAGFDDLRAALEGASGRDLGEWADAWLGTGGVNTLRVVAPVDSGGRYRGVAVRQTAAQERPTLRAHRLGVGLYDLVDGALVRRELVEGTAEGAHCEWVFPGEEVRRADVLLLNDEDLAYAKVRFDAGTSAVLERHLGGLPGSLARALVWSTWWDEVRDGERTADSYLRLVASWLPAEGHSGVLKSVQHTVRATLGGYAAPDLVPEAFGWLGDAAATAVDATAGGRQLFWAQMYAAHGRSPGDVERLRGWLDGADVPAGLAMDSGMRWTVVQGLAAAGAVGDAEIDAEASRDGTIAGRDRALMARAALATAEGKAAAWALLADPETVNREQRAVCFGFWQPGQGALTRPYVEPYLDLVTRLWDDGRQERARELAGYTAFMLADSETLGALERWLGGDGRPEGLRRLVAVTRDEVARALRARG